jgi:hypothetical protein
MPTSLAEQLTSAVCLDDEPLGPGLMGYFDAESRDEMHGLILDLFMQLAADGRMSKATLARRAHMSPAQVTRYLAAPGNWTSDTYTHLALAMGRKPKHALEDLSDVERTNEHHPGVEHGEMVEATKSVSEVLVLPSPRPGQKFTETRTESVSKVLESVGG